MKTQKAFTLIEVLMYAVLASMFFGGVLSCAFSLIGTMQDDVARMELLEESNFLAAKIFWVFSGAKDFSLKDNPAIFVGLVSQKMIVKNLVFQDVPHTVDEPAGLMVSFTLQVRSDSGRLVAKDTNFNLFLQR